MRTQGAASCNCGVSLVATVPSYSVFFCVRETYSVWRWREIVFGIRESQCLAFEREMAEPEATGFAEAQLQAIAGVVQGLLDKALKDVGAKTNAGTGDEGDGESQENRGDETTGEPGHGEVGTPPKNGAEHGDGPWGPQSLGEKERGRFDPAGAKERAPSSPLYTIRGVPGGRAAKGYPVGGCGCPVRGHVGQLSGRGRHTPLRPGGGGGGKPIQGGTGGRGTPNKVFGGSP